MSDLTYQQSKWKTKTDAIVTKLKKLRPYLKVVGYGETFSRVVVKCTDCGTRQERHAEYFIKYNCVCKKKQPRIESVASRKKLLQSQMAKCLVLMGDYVNSSTKIKVRCKKHNVVWNAYPGNLRKGHSCVECGKEERTKACKDKYGVDHHMKTSKTQRKFKQSMLKRHGVEHANQNPKIFDKMIKSSAKRKEYVLGKKIVTVQGYEPAALDYLQEVRKIKAKDIECGTGNRNIPKIEYVYNGKTRVYFPDIYLPKLNRIIEVKSEYTYRVCLEQNRKKRKAAKKAGYKISFLLMNKNGSLYAIK